MKPKIIPVEAQAVLAEVIRKIGVPGASGAELQAALYEELKHYGVHASCKVCGQTTATYRRPLGESQAATLCAWYANWPDMNYHRLIELYRKCPKLPTIQGGDFAKLRWWGFIREHPVDKFKEDKKHSGTWKITQDGVDWVNRKIKVPPAVYTYNNHVLGDDADQSKWVTVTDCIGRKFSYLALIDPDKWEDIRLPVPEKKKKAVAV